MVKFLSGWKFLGYNLQQETNLGCEWMILESFHTFCSTRNNKSQLIHCNWNLITLIRGIHNENPEINSILSQDPFFSCHVTIFISILTPAVSPSSFHVQLISLMLIYFSFHFLLILNCKTNKVVNYKKYIIESTKILHKFKTDKSLEKTHQSPEFVQSS